MRPEPLENYAPEGPAWRHNGSNMAPWTPLGDPWAPTLLPEAPRSPPGGALWRPGGGKKFVVGAFGASWGEKVVDFTLPEAPREGPRVALGGHFGSIFPGGSPGTKKVRNTINFSMFFEVDLACDFLFFLGLRRGAGANAQS